MVTIRVSKATHETLQRLARAEGRPIGQVASTAVGRYDHQRALAELNASYAMLAADPAAWADWQAELKSFEGTLMNGIEDNLPEDQDVASLGSPPHFDVASLRGAAGTLAQPLPWQRVKEIAREDHLASEDRREP